MAFAAAGASKMNAFVNGNGTQTDTLSGTVIHKWWAPISFTDSRVNAGASTEAWLEVTATAINSLQQVQIHRLIFDDNSTSRPAETPGLNLNDAFLPSPIPEPGSNLALLALGAGGLTLRRRLKRAA